MGAELVIHADDLRAGVAVGDMTSTVQGVAAHGAAWATGGFGHSWARRREVSSSTMMVSEDRKTYTDTYYDHGPPVAPTLHGPVLVAALTNSKRALSHGIRRSRSPR